MLEIYAYAFLVEIADMTVARTHFKILSKELAYRLGFGRGFDYY